MASKPVTLRRGKIDPTAGAGAIGLTLCEIGTPGSNGLSSKSSVISTSSRTSSNSCPPGQPRTPVLRKNSPLTGSSNGLSSKTGGSNNKAPSSNHGPHSSNSKKVPPVPPGKVVGHSYLKAAKSAPLAKPGIQATSKPFSNAYNRTSGTGSETESVYFNGNGEQGDLDAQNKFCDGNGYFGEIDASDMKFDEDNNTNSSSNETPAAAGEEVKDGNVVEKLPSNGTENGTVEGLSPLPSGPVKQFLSREIGGQQPKAKSVPNGLGLCYGIGETNPVPQSQPQNNYENNYQNNHLQNNHQPESSSSCSSPIVGLGAGKPVIHGTISNSKPTTPIRGGKYTHTINGVNVNVNGQGHDNGGMVNGNGHAHDIFGARKSPKPGTEMSYQEAFSHLHKVRNVLNESGMCSLEDHQHVAAIETLLLKIFYQKGSKFQN